jgi:hypothetical protein
VISVQLKIVAHYRKFFLQRLGNKHSIEWIAMEEWKRRQLPCVRY